MNFRRVLTALALIAVFTALASAQVTPATQVTCAVSAASAPNVRSEGLTERVGDLKLTCTGGLAPQSGSAADRATIVVDYGMPLTSKNDVAVSGGSEILLVIDEPGTLSNAGASSLGISGFGPNVAGINGVCTTAQQGGGQIQTDCPSFAVQTTSGFWVMSATNAVAGGNAKNAYQGVIGTGNNNTKVTFTNVPIVPPIASGVQRVFRIVNARVNPNGTTGAVTATVTSANVTSGASTLAATGSAQVATAAASITTSVTSTPVSSCITPVLNAAQGQPKANVALLKFTEQFGSAFRTRVLSVGNNADEATGNGAALTAVTGSYTVGNNTVSNNSESGVVQAIGAFTAGLANSGTRLKAVFRNLDPKATYYVSLNPVTDFSANVTAPAVVGGNSTSTWAVLIGNTGVAQETAAYAAIAASGNGPANGAVPVAALTVGTDANSTVVGTQKGTAEAVWEVTNVAPGTAETFTFALYAVYTQANPPATNPTTAASVQLGYAPTVTSTAADAQNSWVPRFAASPAGVGFFSVLPCQTSLLFPYVTNAAGFETGIAIANTGKDPFGTTSTSGTCTLNFYGANAPTTAPVTSALNGGDTYANTLSNLGLTNFQGYLISVCNFQYAHGFAFMNDAKFQVAQGYLAIVIDSQLSKAPRAGFQVGESLGQ